jgi:HAD superfamily hydrolase (TIGR01458 family)
MQPRALLLDLDGVFYEGAQVVPGAPDAVRWFQHRGIPHLFLTNTTSRPREALVKKLASLGMAVDRAHLFTPPVAAHQWLREQACRNVALFVPEATAAEFSGLPTTPGEAARAGAVVLGDLGEAWDFATLNHAFRLLMADDRTPLVALGMTRYWRAEDGLRLDVGPFVRALEYATDRQATVLGKPAAPLFEAALALLDATAEETVMVGDDIRSDIEAAQQVGMRAVLVRTGKFRPADLTLGIEPAAVLESVAELPHWWQRQLS